jgi:hypothetical protein
MKSNPDGKLRAQKMRIWIKKLPRLLGYDIRRYINPFEVQQELIGKTNPVIFDVGAHLGLVTKLYRELFPSALIHSFEPSPESFQKLKKYHLRDTNVVVHRNSFVRQIRDFYFKC